MEYGRGRKCSKVIMATLLAGTVLSAPAFGQDRDDGDVIVVTAQKREQTLQETPVAVSVIGGDTLDATGTSSVEALTDFSPSLTFQQGSNELNSSLNIRGVGTSVFSTAVEPSVSIVIDDVVMARAGQGFQDLIDIERVEVLRGPQSTLFGKNASAGVVSVTTSDPSASPTAAFDAEATNDGAYAFRGTVSAPLSDTVGFRLSGFYKDFDGYIDQLGEGPDAGSYENYGVRGKLQFEPSDKFTLKLIGDWRESESVPGALVVRDNSNPAYLDAIAPVIPGTENDQINTNGENFSDTSQWGLQANAEYTFDNDFTLTSITAYRTWDFENNIDVDGLPLQDPQPGGLLTFDVNNGRTDLSQFSEEIRLASPRINNFDFLLGAFAFQLDADRSFQRRLEIAIPAGQIAQSARFDGGVKTTNLALFASGNLYFNNDATTIFGGIRGIYEELEWDAFRDPANVLVPGDLPFGGTLGTFADFSDSTDDTALVGNIGVRQSFNDFVDGYASYSRGYKGQAYTVAFASVDGLDIVDAEESDAYELGLKMSSPGGKWNANFALFHTEYDNFQAQGQRPGEITFELTNAGTVKTSGFEAELIGSPTEYLDVNLGYAFIDATIDEFPRAPCYTGQTPAEGCVDGAQDLGGAELPFSPDHRFTAFARQVIPFSGQSFNGFVQVNGSWQSEQQYTLANDPRSIQEGYGIINGAVGLRDKDGRWEGQVFANNIADQFYTSNITPFGLFGGIVYQNLPRNYERFYGVRLRFNFN
jgi:iron complex outermembrane receptor protein